MRACPSWRSAPLATQPAVRFLAALSAAWPPDGSTRALPVLKGLVRKPWELRALLRLARDTNRALEALRAFAALDLETLMSR